MFSHCPKCNLSFQPEPGYYYGAMYVSYAFTVAIAGAVFLIGYFLSDTMNIPLYLLQLTLILALLAPYTFRTSRAIWLNIFNRYHPEIRQEVKHKPDQKVDVF